MKLEPLRLKPGIYKNGTRYQAKGRYFDASLVRWYNGSLRPIGGWERFKDPITQEDLPPIVADPTTEFVRDIHVWRDNSGQRHYLFGSNFRLYHMRDDAVITDVTPTEIATPGATANPPPPPPSGNATPTSTETFNDGYGAGIYGLETYGTPRTGDNVDGSLPPPDIPPDPDPPNPPDAGPPPGTTTLGRWKFDNWGENVICFADWTGRLYEFVPPAVGSAPNPASRIMNAPVDLIDFVVSDDYIVIGIGSTTDARRVRTSDRENNNLWFPQDDNYCIDRVLAGTGSFISITKTGSRFIILSETDCHVGNFIGLPFVYSIEEIGRNCAPVNKQAVIPYNIGAAWFGIKDFFVFDGNSVQIVPCDILDFLLGSAIPAGLYNMVGYNNADYQELWWIYQTTPDTQPDRYVYWSWSDNHWNIGALDRMAALESGVLNNPLMVDHDAQLYFHELDKVLPDGNAFAKTGPVEESDGDEIVHLSQIIPDANTQGAFSIEVEGRYYPTDLAPRTYGPYPFANPMPTRASGRELMLTINGGPSFWQFGNQRIRINKLSGKR